MGWKPLLKNEEVPAENMEKRVLSTQERCSGDCHLRGLKGKGARKEQGREKHKEERDRDRDKEIKSKREWEKRERIKMQRNP